MPFAASISDLARDPLLSGPELTAIWDCLLRFQKLAQALQTFEIEVGWVLPCCWPIEYNPTSIMIHIDVVGGVRPSHAA